MDNGPISVSAPGKSLVGAVGADITFNTRYPFAKIDSTNNKSFQIVTLFFAVDPPNPNGTSSFYQRNLVYSFPHGYAYVPSTMFLVSLNNFTSAVGSEGYFLAGGGDFGTTEPAAVLIIEADETNLYFYVDKYANQVPVTPPPPPANILGYFVSIRLYTFINDLSGTDVPTHS